MTWNRKSQKQTWFTLFHCSPWVVDEALKFWLFLLTAKIFGEVLWRWLHSEQPDALQSHPDSDWMRAQGTGS